MEDPDHPDLSLAQIPLVKNPAFQTPKPVTLNTNYNKLIPTLALTVKPPKLNVGVEEVEEWKKDLEKRQHELEEVKGEKESAFHNWVNQQATRIAPGLSETSQVMKPTRVASPPQEQELSNGSEMNELDHVFGAARLN